MNQRVRPTSHICNLCLQNYVRVYQSAWLSIPHVKRGGLEPCRISAQVILAIFGHLQQPDRTMLCQGTVRSTTRTSLSLLLTLSGPLMLLPHGVASDWTMAAFTASLHHGYRRHSWTRWVHVIINDKNSRWIVIEFVIGISELRGRLFAILEVFP